MVEIKARGAAKAEFTNVNEHFAATNNAEFGLFQLNLTMFKSQDGQIPRRASLQNRHDLIFIWQS
jgi:hypothetical protein